MTIASDLVRFLMQLFGDRHATQEFLDNPERVLEDHGLGAVCSADVDAAMPVVLDYAPVTINASRFDREYNTGGTGATTAQAAVGIAYTPLPQAVSGDGGGYHADEDHTHAVQQLQRIVNNYSYTSTVDDRDSVTDLSVNPNIWADGDVEQWFDNDSVIASGDRAIAAGDDADVDDSNNIEDSYTKDDSTDNSIHAVGDVNIGNEETDFDDSFNTDVDIDADLDNVGNIDHREDNSTTIDIRDSGNDNSIDDSFDTETEVDIEADLDNVGNTDVYEVIMDNVGNETVSLDNVGNENTEMENFGNDNSHDESLTLGDIEDNNFAVAEEEATIEDS